MVSSAKVLNRPKKHGSTRWIFAAASIVGTLLIAVVLLGVSYQFIEARLEPGDFLRQGSPSTLADTDSISTVRDKEVPRLFWRRASKTQP